MKWFEEWMKLHGKLLWHNCYPEKMICYLTLHWIILIRSCSIEIIKQLNPYLQKSFKIIFWFDDRVTCNTSFAFLHILLPHNLNNYTCFLFFFSFTGSQLSLEFAGRMVLWKLMALGFCRRSVNLRYNLNYTVLEISQKFIRYISITIFPAIFLSITKDLHNIYVQYSYNAMKWLQVQKINQVQSAKIWYQLVWWRE